MGASRRAVDRYRRGFRTVLPYGEATTAKDRPMDRITHGYVAVECLR